MSPTEIRKLAALGGVCGETVVVRVLGSGRRRKRRRLCLLPPDHAGAHEPWWPPGPISERDRLLRKLAKKSVLAERRDRSEKHLRHQIEIERARWVRAESYIGFRIEYRIRGAYRRTRRWRRQLAWAIRYRTLSEWRW